MKSKDVCRLCLQRVNKSSKLSIGDTKIRCKLEIVFSFPITLDENYPARVCSDCCTKVEEFYNFSESVRSNQEQLTSVPENVPSIQHISMDYELKQEPTPRDEQDCIVENVDIKVELIQDNEVVSDRENSCDEKWLKNDDSSSDEGMSTESEPPKRRKRKLKEPKPSGAERKLKRSYNTKSKEQREEDNRQLKEFYQMKCDLCDHSADNFKALNDHYQETHDIKGYVICCNKKLDKRVLLLEHLVLHKNPDAYRCEICNKNYKNKMYLSLHQSNIHGSEADRPFKCDRCPQSFAKAYQLRGHLVYHEKVQCPHCDRVLSNRNALSVHIVNLHSGGKDGRGNEERRMICDTCGKEFLNKACFERHIQEHMGIEVAKLQCHLCQKWLKGKWLLKKHLQFSHYDRDRQHVCDICQQHYPNSRALFVHKKQVHIEEKFECEFCGKKFKRASNLKEHRTIHTGEVLYSCVHCGATMNSRSNLYTHIKKHHPVEWAENKRKAEEAKAPKV